MLRLGIYTRWQKHDAALAASALASYARSVGLRPSLLAAGSRSTAVDADWDHSVIGGGGVHGRSLRRKADYRRRRNKETRNWITTKDQVIFTEPPSEDLIFHANRKSVNTVIWTSWEDIKPDDDVSLNMADVVLVPSAAQREMLRSRFKLKHAAVFPYCPYLPITRKPPRHDNGFIRLFMTLWGSQLKRVRIAIISSLTRILDIRPRVSLTLACAKGLSANMRRELKRLTKLYGDRFRVLYNQTWQAQLLEMAAHDVTVWPAMCDGHGIIGVSSLFMGTPVVAFKAPPFNDYLVNGKNALLTNCKLEHNHVGKPLVIADYRDFEETLLTVCDDPILLAELTANTHKQLPSVCAAFINCASKFLPVI